nr:reverse transcriptase domain-containing protein [Tanacetum cinerariifolium]
MTHLLEKETPFVFSKECVDAFNTLKKKLTEAPIMVVPDWNLPFELMCDASDFAIGAVLGQRKTKHFQPIHYASKTMTEAQIHYTTTEKEMLAVICESNSHYGYECSQRVPLVYEPEPCYTQNFSDNDYSHDLPGVNPLIDHHCCYKCGNSLNDFFCYQCNCEFFGNGAHVGYNCPAQVPSFQTLPSFPQQYPCCEDCGGLPEADHCQPPQYTVNHPIFNAHNDLLNSQNKLMEQMISMCEMILTCYDDDDDYNFAITPNEPVDSLIMGDEHLDTIPATKSDEFIKSSVENLVPNPSDSKGENGCDAPACFTTFSNILFDADYDFYSSDDQSLYDEDVPEKIFSNPLFEEEIIPMKIEQHHDNAESELVESLCTHDSSLIISSKIDSLLDEFAGELTLLKSIPSGLMKLIVILRKTFVLSRDCCTITHLLVLRKNLFMTILMLKLNLSLHLLSPLRIVTLLWKKLIYPLLWMTQCCRALRKMTMILKGIF